MRAFALACFVLVCAACGSSAAPLSPVAAAAKKTSSHGGSYTMAIDFSKVEKNGGTYTGHGSFDGDGNFTLDVNYRGMPIHAISATDPSHHVVVYMQSAAFTGQLPEDKTWVSVDLTRLVGRSGSGSKALDAVESPGSDPTQVLGWLERSSSGSRKLGTGTAGGVRVVRYRVTLDLAKAAKEPGLAGREAQQLERTAKAAHIPVDVSIDGNGDVRAIDEHVRGGGRIAFRITQLGGRQAIEPPPAGDVFDVTDQLPAS